MGCSVYYETRTGQDGVRAARGGAGESPGVYPSVVDMCDWHGRAPKASHGARTPKPVLPTMTASDASDSEGHNSGSPLATSIAIEDGLPQQPADLFSLYTSVQRRAAIRYLADELEPGEVIDAGELATEITARLTDCDPDQVDGTTRKSVYVGLSQNHLDKLEKTNVIERTDEGIAPTAATATVATLMKHVEAVCRGHPPDVGGEY